MEFTNEGIEGGRVFFQSIQLIARGDGDGLMTLLGTLDLPEVTTAYRCMMANFINLSELVKLDLEDYARRGLELVETLNNDGQ